MSFPQALGGNSHRDSAPTLIGTLRDVVEELGGAAEIHDLYDSVGAQIYDDTASQDPSEIRELSRIVRATSGPVLELAAGSGRLTLPLLRLRRAITALELSGDMLDLLRARLTQLPEGTASRLRLVQGDMSDFDLGSTFGVVVLGTSSISLLTAEQQTRMFRCIDGHLDEGGRLLLSVAEVVDADAVPHAHTADITGRSGYRYRMHHSFEPESGRRQVGVHPVDRSGERVPVCVSQPALVNSSQVTDDLHTAGFTVVARHPVTSVWSGFEEFFLEARRTNDSS